MMDFSLEQVNKWAKKSCPKWNPNGLTRRLNRAKYRDAAKKYWESDEAQKMKRSYEAGVHQINTYPWPYSDPEFANWEEDDSPKGYNLISDQSGCVIRYSTSYCAWKIFEATGKWPQKASRRRMDAKDWQHFLAEAGYTKIATHLNRHHHYVGIKPDEGEFGLVVWAESFELEDFTVYVSTYIDGGYRFMAVEPTKFLWVEIS